MEVWLCITEKQLRSRNQRGVVSSSYLPCVCTAHPPHLTKNSAGARLQKSRGIPESSHNSRQETGRPSYLASPASPAEKSETLVLCQCTTTAYFIILTIKYGNWAFVFFILSWFEDKVNNRQLCAIKQVSAMVTPLGRGDRALEIKTDR